MFSFQAASQPEPQILTWENQQSKRLKESPEESLKLPQREPRLQPTPVRTVSRDESLGYSPESCLGCYGAMILNLWRSQSLCMDYPNYRRTARKKRAKMFSKKGGTRIPKASPRPSVHSFDFNQSGNATVTKNPKDGQWCKWFCLTTAIVSFREMNSDNRS
jgi:hypothetical protein